ncbi:hypothetical protein LX16_4295 [Stackebrandtia albiflava]|uniref:Uncharacterized protein n=1 Tax=Stackebrandtia albiflava TaxID=406432 RepID=A0A562UR22_9ACTN|nr:hypothetical protein [Stackebrandtia albiflava]TWJ08075.1 hypothetical protein LX16_4295 [Stackebrandtia albiflava]
MYRPPTQPEPVPPDLPLSEYLARIRDIDMPDWHARRDRFARVRDLAAEPVDLLRGGAEDLRSAGSGTAVALLADELARLAVELAGLRDLAAADGDRVTEVICVLDGLRGDADRLGAEDSDWEADLDGDPEWLRTAMRESVREELRDRLVEAETAIHDLAAPSEGSAAVDEDRRVEGRAGPVAPGGEAPSHRATVGLASVAPPPERSAPPVATPDVEERTVPSHDEDAAPVATVGVAAPTAPAAASPAAPPGSGRPRREPVPVRLPPVVPGSGRATRGGRDTRASGPGPVRRDAPDHVDVAAHVTVRVESPPAVPAACSPRDRAVDPRPEPVTPVPDAARRAGRRRTRLAVLAAEPPAGVSPPGPAAGSPLPTSAASPEARTRERDSNPAEAPGADNRSP